MVIEIDPKKAAEMIGKKVLVGVTYRDQGGAVMRTCECFGTINRINADEGLVIIRGDTNEEMERPPLLGNYSHAD